MLINVVPDDSGTVRARNRLRASEGYFAYLVLPWSRDLNECNRGANAKQVSVRWGQRR